MVHVYLKLTGLIFLIIFAAVRAEGADWIEVTSDHFQLTTDLPEKRALEVVDQLEKTRLALAYLTRKEPNENAPIFRIFGFQKTGDYLRISGIKRTAGYFTYAWDGPVSLSSLARPDGQWGMSGLQIAIHEYVHFFMRSINGAQYPIWYDEGFADFISTMRFEEDRAIIGDAHPNRIYGLAVTPNWMDFSKILTRKATGKRRDSMIYSVGWLLTHYLWEDAERTATLNRYLQAYSTDSSDPVKVFEDTFGITPKQMDKELRSYWKKGQLRVGSFSLDAFKQPIKKTVRRFNKLESKAMPYRAMVVGHSRSLDNNGIRKKAIKAFEALYKAQSDDVDEALMIGELQSHSPDTPEDALTTIDAALASNQSDPRLATFRLYTESFSNPIGSMAKTEVSAYKKLLDGAIDAAPDYIPARFARARLALSPFQPVTEQTLADMNMVSEKWPGNVGLTTDYARLAMKTGNYSLARSLLVRLRGSARGERFSQTLDQLLATIDAVLDADANAS